MKKIVEKVYELPEVGEYLLKRKLIKQYLKIVEKLLSANYWKIDFKKRQPKNSWIWSFRINKQFRAIWYFREKWIFVVVKIDNHQ